MPVYTALTSLALADGTRALAGNQVKLDAKDAKPLLKAKAIEQYFADGDDDFDEEVMPEQTAPVKVRTGKPAAPAQLTEAQTLLPDPKVR